MHLLRWRAIADALADGAGAIDLGGVDLPGTRTPPEQGDPARGLYEHKRSFGAIWVDRTAARRRILRPWAVRMGEIPASRHRYCATDAKIATHARATEGADGRGSRALAHR